MRNTKRLFIIYSPTLLKRESLVREEAEMKTFNKKIVTKFFVLLSIFSFSIPLFPYCTSPRMLSNSYIPCASGLSTNPSDLLVYLWINGNANWKINGTGSACLGCCNESIGGCDSDGVNYVDENCMFDFNSILVDGYLCVGSDPGTYFLYADWSKADFDGCPSDNSLARACLLIVDKSTSKYVLQSMSQWFGWENWDDIGTSVAKPLFHPWGLGVFYSLYCFGANLVFPSDINLYGDYYLDQPQSPLFTGTKLYYYFGCEPPAGNSLEGWIEGPTFPMSSDSFCIQFPPASDGLYVAFTYIVDGLEIPVHSPPVPVVEKPVAAKPYDYDPCAYSGIAIQPDFCCWDCDDRPREQGLVDGSEFLGDVCGYPMGPYIYQGTYNIPHAFQFREAVQNGQVVSCWTDPKYAIDENHTPSSPVITSIVDLDPSQQSGVQIFFDTSPQAVSYDLYRDNVLVQSNFTSGGTFLNTDCNVFHNYSIRAVGLYGCTSFSSPVSAVDSCEGAPPEIGTGQEPSDYLLWSSDKTTLYLPYCLQGTGYRLYRGTQSQLSKLITGETNCCKRYEGSDRNVLLTEDDPQTENGRFFWYVVTAYNEHGEGSAGSGRLINSSGVCQ